MGVGYRHWHQHLGFGTGITKHQALIAGSLIEIESSALVNPLSDIWRLFVDGGQHRTRLPIEPHIRGVIANLTDGLADNRGHVHPGLGGDLAGNQGHPGGYQGFTGYPGEFILGQNGIENGIGNLIGHFVGVAFGNGLGSEKIVGHFWYSLNPP